MYHNNNQISITNNIHDHSYYYKHYMRYYY